MTRKISIHTTVPDIFLKFNTTISATPSTMMYSTGSYLQKSAIPLYLQTHIQTAISQRQPMQTEILLNIHMTIMII